MLYENTIYEAGGYTLKPYSKSFIDAFMTKPEHDFPLKDGMTDQEYSGTDKYIKKFGLEKIARSPLLVAYEVEDGVWSLNLASDPDIVIAQIDHANKLYRTPEVESPEARTAQIYTNSLFRNIYIHDYDKKRSVVKKRHDDDYGRTAEIITKDWTNSKFLTRLDISNLWKS